MGKKPTKAQLAFLKSHLSLFAGAKKGYLTKFAAHKTYVFVAGCRDAGFVEIVDPDDLFPYNWAGTRITKTGRALIEAKP